MPEEISAALLAWAEAHGRDLPWRATRDPWAVLVAEMMLQQTQVTRVIGRYEAFLARFPDPASAAAAPLGDLLTLWSGLGYNRRARYLHEVARVVVADHGGRLPRDLDALTALPGIGPYTARAVLAFAFEEPVGVVDTNAARVLARAVAGRPLGRSEAQRLADAAVPEGGSWAYNQALLDLGATVCVAGRPACSRCPLEPACAWALAGRPAPDPAARAYRQPAFEGSDRQGRGRVMAALVSGPIPVGQIPLVAGWPEDPSRVARVVDGLVADGLAVRDRRGGLRIP